MRVCAAFEGCGRKVDTVLFNGGLLRRLAQKPVFCLSFFKRGGRGKPWFIVGFGVVEAEERSLFDFSGLKLRRYNVFKRGGRGKPWFIVGFCVG